MSQNKLVVAFCRAYEAEVTRIAAEKQWPDVEFIFLPEVCRHPHLIEEVKQKFSSIRDDITNVHVIGSYMGCITNVEQGQKFSSTRLSQCLHMLIPPNLMDFYLKSGTYLVPPGFVANWQTLFNTWGFDQPMAREMFHESTQKILLVDTQVYAAADKELNVLGEYLDLPVDCLPVGLAYMKLYLNEIVMSWQHEQQIAQFNDLVKQSNRISADYAMAMDVLTQLTQVHGEAEAVDEIINLFTMLFSAQRVQYLPYIEGELTLRGDHLLEKEEFDQIKAWTKDSPNLVKSIEGGFYLKLRFLQHISGVLVITHMTYPEYIHRYMSLAVNISQLCSLVIKNAQITQQLEIAEQQASYEKNVSDTLRELLTKLVSKRDINAVIEQTLNALKHLIPLQSIGVYLLEEGYFRFKGGISAIGDGEIASAAPTESLIAIRENEFSSYFTVAVIEETGKLLSGTDIDESIDQPLAFPIMVHNLNKGYLTVSSAHLPRTQDHISLIYAVANEVSIALENASLFEEIQELAIRDGLTGIYNRRYFYKLVEQEFIRSKRYGIEISLLMIDIDYFKNINDQFGHHVGDVVLKEVAGILQENVRNVEILARFGGEEFVILLPETPIQKAVIVAERIRSAIEAFVFSAPRHEIHLTVSIGIAQNNDHIQSFSELLRAADEGLYQAKGQGRNQIAIHG